VSGPVLVLGGTGRLGRATVLELLHRGREVVAPPRSALDLSDTAALAARIEAFRPSAIVNLSGFTDVNAAERPENHAAAGLLNGEVPGLLASIAARASIPFVHVSTDYVFDGTTTVPYLEDDPVHPLQVYGRTKLDGERAALAAYPASLVLRVSTLFGPDRPDRPAYVDMILRQALPFERSRGTIQVVAGPVSSPTYAPDAAVALADLLERSVTGIVHLANHGACSRLELARATVAACYLSDRVIVTPRPETPGALLRPAYSVLDTGKLQAILGRRMPTWRDALTTYIERLQVGGGE
jgi:dTDP-4-dehydrorhamnose reductase